MRKQNNHEILTGIILGIFISLLFAIKVMGCPLDKEQQKAQEYLDEYQIEIPDEVEEACEYYGDRYDICPETLEAICWVESNCIPSVQSPDKTCKGLMQIKPSCHKERMAKLKTSNVFGVWDNVKIGADYLSELQETTSGDIAVALTMYNGQSKSKIKKAEEGEYSKYVKRILKISACLELIHGK